MQARAPLMIEHRLIERMILVLKQNLSRAEKEGTLDPEFIDMAIDFIRIYADRTHHGKEENILFRDLKERDLSEADRRLMNELMEEHLLGRRTTKNLADANNRYRKGEQSALADIKANLATLAEFYPKHIEKEDKIFFPDARKYFSEEEDQAMLKAFWEFDRKMIHEKYISVVEETEKR
ncbi:MAG: hemerythrin domain-containing protein [Deltaproteobacteria bacterium]|nr:hemerythrin domain-containing protein [Deltaproteobacteria bacterium]